MLFPPDADQDQMSDGGFNADDAHSSRNSATSYTSYRRNSTQGCTNENSSVASSAIFVSRSQERVSLGIMPPPPEGDNIYLPMVASDGNFLVHKISTYMYEVEQENNITEERSFIFFISVVDGGYLQILLHGNSREVKGYAPKVHLIEDNQPRACEHHHSKGQLIIPSTHASIFSKMMLDWLPPIGLGRVTHVTNVIP